jgi:hypothetical protein
LRLPTFNCSWHHMSSVTVNSLWSMISWSWKLYWIFLCNVLFIWLDELLGPFCLLTSKKFWSRWSKGNLRFLEQYNGVREISMLICSVDSIHHSSCVYVWMFHRTCKNYWIINNVWLASLTKFSVSVHSGRNRDWSQGSTCRQSCWICECWFQEEKEWGNYCSRASYQVPSYF